MQLIKSILLPLLFLGMMNPLKWENTVSQRLDALNRK
jgi:hypothetical protein